MNASSEWPVLASATACGAEIFVAIAHVLLVAFVVLVPLVAPAAWLPWALWFFPGVLLLYVMFGECPVTTAELAARNMCRARFPFMPSLFPPVPTTDGDNGVPEEQFFRRFVHSVFGVELTERDVMLCMVLAWMAMYACYFIRQRYHRPLLAMFQNK